MDNDCFKTPPNMVNSNHAKQGQPKNNTEIIMSSPTQSPSPLLSQSPSPSQSAATAPKRIINKIPLDFNKLKQAGLDRKLAEALSKQKLSSAKKIASATTTSTSSSASTSSAASPTAKLSTETASLTQVQQRERLTAALPVRKNTAPNLVTVDEESLHIKALIKNKILNKLANSPGATAATTTATRTTAPASPQCRSSPTNSFTAPIAKADLTARPKLLLNLVNQLPKHRAKCGVSTSPARARQLESTQQPRVRQQPTTASSSPQQKLPRQQQSQSLEAPKPLIVLENKVLAPNEKIDLSALRLSKIHTTEVSSIAMPVPEKLKEMPEKPNVKAKCVPCGSGAKKFIQNANKLKVSREQIAQMARDISKQSNERGQQPVTKPMEDVNAFSSNISELSSTTSIESSLITLNPKTTNIQASLITPVVAEVLPNPKLTSAKNCLAPPSPAASDPSNNVISAVDFIAQLKANISMDRSNYMNLSAEEMSMNALFSGCQSVLPTPVENKAEEELPIGKILKMEDMDILHATMNVDENESNVLCISPNAIKLQKSIKTEEPPVAKETAAMEAESSFLKEALEPLSTKANLNLPTAPALVVTAPQEDTKMPGEPVKEVLLAQLVPLATRSPSFRPKRGKINLVQRNKKARVEKSKSTVETVKKTVMEIDDNVSEAYIPEEVEAQDSLNIKHNTKFGFLDTASENVINVEILNNVNKNIYKEADAKIENVYSGPSKKSVDNQESLECEEILQKTDNMSNQNISKDAEVQEKGNLEIEKKTNLNKMIESEINSNKIDNIRKESISSAAAVPEKLDIEFNKSVSKKINSNSVKMEMTTNLDSTIDNQVNDANEAEIRKGIKNLEEINVEFNKPANNNVITDETVKIKSIINLDTDIESEVNVEKNTSKNVKIQNTKDTQDSKSIDIKETGEIVENKSKNNLNIKNEVNLDNSLETATTKENNLNNPELVASKNVIPSKKETGLEHEASEEAAVETQSGEVPLNIAKKRDLTQLYHPPKMPKLKQKINNNNEEISSKDVTAEAHPTVSLMEVLSQDQPIPQGEAQLPFRQDPKKTISTEKSSTEVTGIQNLLNKLAAENMMPPSKEIKEIKETKAEEPVKAPRKKLVKTRPVLGAKRASKVAPPKTEALHPRKRALLAESKENGTHRVPTSSTSDDDGDMFHGFDNEASSSKRLTNLKNMETDISDDATPDYDETEEDPQPVEMSLTKKPKTESASTEQKLETITEQIDNEKEDKPEPEEARTETTNNQENPEPIEATKETTDNQDTPLQVKLVVAKKKRGRPFKKANKKPEESETVEKTEEAATPLPKKRKRQSKDISKDLTQSESTGDLPVAQQDSEETPVAKRPRKSRAKMNTSISTPATLDTTTEPETKTVKRRGRKSKIILADAVVESTPDPMITSTPDPMITATPDPMITSTTAAIITSTPDDMITPKKRGRKPKFFDLLSKKAKAEGAIGSAGESGKPDGPNNWPQTPDFDLRLLLIRSREQLESGEELREDGQGKGSEQCGLCLVRCNKNDWETHLSEHYGIGWTTDKAPEMLTRGILITMMNNYGKGGNRFTCRLCDRSLGSGLGMMMHLENCGNKQERVECDACKNSYSKLSFAQHYRTCSKRYLQMDTSIEEKADESANTTVYSNAGRAKRKSTIKAESKLHKIAAQLKKPDEPDNKDFNADSSDYDDAADKESSEEYDSEGVDSNEDADQTKDGNKSSADRSCAIKIRNRPRSRAGSTSSKPPISRIIKSGESSEERWKYFIQTNYAKDMLYPHLLPRYDQLLPADAIKLLPSRESTSMRYAYDNVKDNAWIQLAPLETLSANSEHLCHLGRPVKEVAWVPLPSSVETQYLLCSHRPKMHGFTRQMKDKQEGDLLLLLECKMSSAGKDDLWPLQTRLHYGIRVSLGTVNTFEFMPSGGYDKSANRLALLAVGSTSGAVIYSLPLELAKIEENVDPTDAVIVLEPVLTLSLDVDNPVRDPCTKICWSQASGHNLIVTGYASGNIAFWDIADEDGFNCFEQNSQRHFLPASFFYFGERNIQSLELHYDNNGAHWLAVGAAVRKFWVYDISNWSQPLSLVGDLIKYLYLGCISWSPLWESFIVGCSEIIRPQFTRLVSVSPVDISGSSNTLGVMLNSIRDSHFNCDQNTLTSIADNGDVSFLKSSEPFSHAALRRKRDIYSLSMTEACHLSDVSQQEIVTPEVFQRDYGLLLRPLRIEQKKVKASIYKNQKRQPSFSVRSMMRLNCVRWNWNAPASSWVAIGAEHGLLRIMNYDSES